MDYYLIYECVDEIKTTFLRGSVRTKDIYESIGMTLQSFSKYRERLIDKGLIRTASHGYIEMTLPRFGSICHLYGETEW